MYHVQTTEEKINNFGYAEADVSTTRKQRRRYSQQINTCQTAWMLLESTLFKLSKRYTHYYWKLIIDIPNPYYMPDFLSYLRVLLLEAALWSKLLSGNFRSKLDQPLCKYIKENNSFWIAVQWRFIDILPKNDCI